MRTSHGDVESKEERVLRPVGWSHRRHQRLGVWRHRDGARAHATSSANVYAGQNGIIGALTEELIDTGKESAAAIRALRTTPAGAFGSCRYKLKSLDKNRREYERLIEVFRAHDIAWFFYNGGGDSADTCFKVSQLSQSMGYPLQAIHVPKTVDNDLPITDCCPGFGSVAKYVAVSALERRSTSARWRGRRPRCFVPRGHGAARRLDRRRRRADRGARHPGRHSSFPKSSSTRRSSSPRSTPW
jgi:hypothetical protein